MSTGLGERIKNRRMELDMSQEELAHRLGLKSKSTVCKVEKGDDNLTTGTVRKYADALDTTPSYLMGWEDKPEQDNEGYRSESGRRYYFDDETAAMAQRLFEDPDLRMLFDASQDSKAEDLRMAAEMLKRFKETNPDG